MSWLSRNWRQINLTCSICVLTLSIMESKSDSMLPAVGWVFASLELMRPRI